jgi:hypothetical protein
MLKHVERYQERCLKQARTRFYIMHEKDETEYGIESERKTLTAFAFTLYDKWPASREG